MIHAYATPRAAKRKSLSGEVRHAVDEISHLCGAMDTLCGRDAVLHLGPWDPDHPDNCRRCVLALEREIAL